MFTSVAVNLLLLQYEITSITKLNANDIHSFNKKSITAYCQIHNENEESAKFVSDCIGNVNPCVPYLNNMFA